MPGKEFSCLHIHERKQDGEKEHERRLVVQNLELQKLTAVNQRIKTQILLKGANGEF